MADRIRLQSGDLELELCPQAGGVVTAFRGRGHDLMRPAPPGSLASPGDASCFPLVPFSNRIADARFAFGGRSYTLPRNFVPEPHAIHGQGWQLPWRVEERSAARVVMSLAHAVPDTPFDYRARQTFALGDDSLVATIAVTNTGAIPMPAGVGLHPYFPRTEGVTLQAGLDHVWLPDERKIPKQRVPLPPAWDFAAAPRLAALDLDHCFGGWDGRATIHWPETDVILGIEADPIFGHLVIYVPPGEDFFCVEPVSHANDGFNLMASGVDGTGVQVLEPGLALAGSVIFRLD